MATSHVDLMRQFVHRKLEAWPEFKAAVIVGSVAFDEARPDSDVDCVLVFDELDEAIVPAEFVWVPETDSYHTIFEVEASEVGGLQIDAKRVTEDDFLNHEWSDQVKHEMAHSIVLYDRHRAIADAIKRRIAYPESLRVSRIREHVGWVQYGLEEWRLLGWIERGGIEAAHDQLTVAFEEMVRILHAYNREWLPARYRWMVSARKLAWLPQGYSEKAGEIVCQVSADRENLLHRRHVILSLLEEALEKFELEGLLADSDDAFIASHPGLGYAHNFDDWRRAHRDLSKRMAGLDDLR